MAVVSLINRKGGVGKTTLTLALADFLSGLFGKRVLLLDLDPQANLTLAVVGEERWVALERARKTIADIFDATVKGQSPRVVLESTHRISGGMPLHIIASTPRLADVESEALEADQVWRRRIGSPYLVLHRALESMLDAYDYVLIDCPPSLGVITLNGLALSDGFLIPVMPSPIAVTGIEMLVAKIREFSRGLHRPIKHYGTVVNRVSMRTNLHPTILQELIANPDAKPVWDSRVSSSVRAEEGWEFTVGARTLSQRWGYLYSDLFSLTEEFVRRVR